MDREPDADGRFRFRSGEKVYCPAPLPPIGRCRAMVLFMTSGEMLVGVVTPEPRRPPPVGAVVSMIKCLACAAPLELISYPEAGPCPTFPLAATW